MVSDSRNIALNYLRGWFVVDLLAALPFDHLYASDLYTGEVSHPFKFSSFNNIYLTIGAVWFSFRI